MQEVSMMRHVDDAIEFFGFIEDQSIERQKRRMYDHNSDNLRRVNVFGASAEGDPAILVVYDDPRESRLGEAMARFKEVNQNHQLISPRVLGQTNRGTKQGWVLMERIDLTGSYLLRPAFNKQDREALLTLYREYRTEWNRMGMPQQLFDREKGSAVEYMKRQLEQWRSLGMEMEDRLRPLGKNALDLDAYEKLYQEVLSRVLQDLQGRSMEYGHGGFYTANLPHLAGGQVALLNFSRAGMKHEGEEPALMLWEALFQRMTYEEPLGRFLGESDEWIDDLTEVVASLGYKNPYELILAAVLGRGMATISADVCATDDKTLPVEQKKHRIEYLSAFLRHVLSKG